MSWSYRNHPLGCAAVVYDGAAAFEGAARCARLSSVADEPRRTASVPSRV